MKLSCIPVILTAAAGLVSAAPIRVVIISTGQRAPVPDALPAWAQSVRWGHAAAPAFNSFPGLSVPGQPIDGPRPWRIVPNEPINMNEPVAKMRKGAMRKGGCRGGMRAKSMELGNKLRVILGLPAIDYLPRPHPGMHGVVVEALPQVKAVPAHHHHYHHMHHRTSFTVRLSHAIAALGPWEGRAVSFVLGCGLGVILRMLFVFGVLIVRSVRGRNQERQVALEEDTVIFVADIKEPVVETLPAYAEKSENTPQGNNASH